MPAGSRSKPGVSMSRPFEISLSSHALCGVACALQVPERLKALGLRRVGVVADEVALRQPPIQSLLHEWQSRGLESVDVYASRSGQEPDYDYLDEVAGRARPLDLDAIIGIGGGSAMDLAKGVGVLLRNPGCGIAYRGMNLVRSPGAPVVLVPTVAGCGSEVTATASFIDRTSETKLGINGNHVACLFSVLDPTLLVTCPSSVTLGSGLDALVHATEAVTARTATPLSRFFGAEAVRLLFTALPVAVSRPTDLGAQETLLMASFYAGIAMTHAAGGPASGISYPLGVHWNVPHGYAGGLLLPPVVAANVEKGYTEGYAYLQDRATAGAAAKMAKMTEFAKAGIFRDSLTDLYRRVGAPASFERWNVDRGAVAELADLTVRQRHANLDLNPVAFGRDDVVRVLETVLSMQPAARA